MCEIGCCDRVVLREITMKKMIVLWALAICVTSGGLDSYDFHGYEAAQSMSERRKGGETGISSVTALTGESLWTEMERSDRQRTRELFVSALTRSHNLPVADGYPIERTLLTSGMVIGGVESMHAGQKPFETPQMGVAYQASKDSAFWRE